MRHLELPAGKSPREWGRLHGESFRGEIQSLAAIRTYLCTKVGRFRDREQVLAAAQVHLPVLEAYDRALYDELLGIAEGAAMTPADIVVVNHYTDLRDLDPDPATWRRAGDEGCSMLWAKTESGPILAQTWDMHATAIPYVMLLSVGAHMKLLSVVGCLGMAGMSSAGVAVTINNMFSTDARVGVVWSAIVRRMLNEVSARTARGALQSTPVGSGRHFFMTDRVSCSFGIEFSGTQRAVVFAGETDRFCHTNHPLAPEIAERTRIPETSTTHDRLRWLERDLARAPVRDLADAWARLGSTDGYPRSVCTNMSTPEAPHGAATCGAIAMNTKTGELWAQQGFIHHVAPEKFHV